MQLSLENILRWSDDNGLPINLKKSCRMHFGSKNVSLPYHLGHTTLVERTCERDLGVYIDNRMKFDDHIRHVVMKARSVAGRILRCFSSRNPFVILPLFDTLVRPILEYATPAWNPSLTKHILKSYRIRTAQRNKAPLRSAEILVRRQNSCSGSFVSTRKTRLHWFSRNVQNYSQLLCVRSCCSTYTQRICHAWARIPTRTMQMFTKFV
jgi:hypothetical protein